MRLPVEHGEVFPLLLRRVLALKQIDVVHNARERRFDVVRYVGDQLRLEPFALELLLHRDAHAAADGIEVFAVALEIEVHMRGIDLRGEVARSEGFAALLQPPQLHRKQARRDRQHRDQHQQQPVRVIALKRKEQHADHAAADRRAPHERDTAHEAGQRSPRAAEHAPAPPQNPSAEPEEPTADGVLPPSPQLHAGTERRPERKEKRIGERSKGKQKGERDRIKAVKPLLRALHRGDNEHTASAEKEQCIEIKGELLLPARNRLLAPRPAARGTGEEDEEEQLRGCTGDHDRRCVRRKARHRVVEVPRPVDAVLRGIVHGDVAAEHNAVLRHLTPPARHGNVACAVVIEEDGARLVLDRKTDVRVAVVGGIPVVILRQHLRLPVLCIIVVAVVNMAHLAVDRARADAAFIKVSAQLAAVAERERRAVAQKHRHEHYGEQKGCRLGPEAAGPIIPFHVEGPPFYTPGPTRPSGSAAQRG